MIVAFGEALLRLCPPGHQRVEQATTFEIEIGGAELNTAVGLVRLGREVSWVSRVPDSPLGQMVRQRVRSLGVDDSHIINGSGRQGLYYLEQGAAPRASSIIYDRADSAMARLKSTELDWPKIIPPHGWLHVTGITAAICPDSVRAAIAAAKAADARISFDLNYRSKLWSVEEAGRVLGEMIPFCDLLFASENDAKLLFGIQGSLSEIAERFQVKSIATMRRESQSLWRDRIHATGWHDGKTIQTEPIEVEVVDRIGTGDAFAAGVIHGAIDDEFERSLQTGTAMAALAHTIPGDLLLVTKDEVDAVMKGAGLRIRR
jgi:2-dehydro-3-deoxygluconokinase